jgi:hypothetical protein
VAVESVKNGNDHGLFVRAEAGTSGWPKAAYIFMGLLLAYALVRSLFGSAAKPFWVDEFCTLAVAQQPDARRIWDALSRGVDSAPPLFYLIEAGFLKMFPHKEIAMRLPSTLAFFGTLVCVFAFAKKRSSEWVGCLCATLLLSTTLFEIYATDGRAYSMVIFCVALAMVCYQRLPSAGWVTLFGLSLAVAESLHYFAVFAMAPFWMAEAALLLKARKIRWTVWAALVFGVLPLAVFWRLLLAYRDYYGGHIVFAHPAAGKIPEYWGSLFLIDAPYGAGLALGALAAIVSWWQWKRGGDAGENAKIDDGLAAEAALLVGFVLLPIVAFVLVRMANAILTNRYMQAAALGIALGIGCGLSMARRKMWTVFALFLLVSIGLREYGFWRNGHRAQAGDLTTMRMEEFREIDEFVQSGGHSELPLVYGPGLSYMRVAYYGPPDLIRRMVYLLDAQRETRVEGNDTLAKIMTALREDLHLRVEDYSRYVATNREFLLYSDGSQTDWVPQYLDEDGASFETLKTQGSRRLYLVRSAKIGGPANETR